LQIRPDMAGFGRRSGNWPSRQHGRSEDRAKILIRWEAR
jgi:hypothetical protein